MFYIETICGSNRRDHAAGGGCGAPMGVRKVSKETFEATHGSVGDEPFEHSSNECTFEGGQVKLVFDPCSSCSCNY